MEWTLGGGVEASGRIAGAGEQGQHNPGLHWDVLKWRRLHRSEAVEIWAIDLGLWVISFTSRLG